MSPTISPVAVLVIITIAAIVFLVLFAVFGSEGPAERVCKRCGHPQHGSQRCGYRTGAMVHFGCGCLGEH